MITIPISTATIFEIIIPSKTPSKYHRVVKMNIEIDQSITKVLVHDKVYTQATTRGFFLNTVTVDPPRSASINDEQIKLATVPIFKNESLGLSADKISINVDYTTLTVKPTSVFRKINVHFKYKNILPSQIEVDDVWDIVKKESIFYILLNNDRLVRTAQNRVTLDSEQDMNICFNLEPYITHQISLLAFTIGNVCTVDENIMIMGNVASHNVYTTGGNTNKTEIWDFSITGI